MKMPSYFYGMHEPTFFLAKLNTNNGDGGFYGFCNHEV